MKGAAPEVKHLATLKCKPRGVAKRREIEYAGPVNAHTVYSPAAFQEALPCGRAYYEGLVKAGLPVRNVSGRHWISGRLAIEFFEKGKPDGEGQATQKTEGDTTG